MDTSKLKAGDRVKVDVRGLVFDARYDGPASTHLGGHMVFPLRPNVSYRCVGSRQIVKRLESGVEA
jgi:hypothetical protein